MKIYKNICRFYQQSSRNKRKDKLPSKKKGKDELKKMELGSRIKPYSANKSVINPLCTIFSKILFVPKKKKSVID